MSACLLAQGVVAHVLCTVVPCILQEGGMAAREGAGQARPYPGFGFELGVVLSDMPRAVPAIGLPARHI